MALNPKVASWFDAGDAVSALVGDGRFYIHAPGFTVHDRLHIVDQLYEWAGTDADRSRKAARAVTDATHVLLATERTDEAIDLLLAFLMATEDSMREALVLDAKVVVDDLLAAERWYRNRSVLTKQRADAIDRIRAKFAKP